MDKDILAKAELWDLFVGRVKKQFNLVQKVGQQEPVLPFYGKRIGEEILSSPYFSSSNIEEVLIHTLVGVTSEQT